MKISIITLPIYQNYGGLLQSYALQTILKQNGDSVITYVLPSAKIRGKKAKILYAVRILFYKFTDKKGRFLGIWKHKSISRILSSNTRSFVQKYMNVRDYYRIGKKDFDVIVVGSDQVWRPKYVDTDITFLSFANSWNKVKKIAYAASFGTDEWEFDDVQTLRYAACLKRFTGISVRERSAISLCKDHFDAGASLVLDPTMLLSSEDYIRNLGLECIEKSDGTLFYYVLDTTADKRAFIKRIASCINMKAFTINSKIEDVSASVQDRIHPPVEKWLRGFMDAQFVITDSFHGCVFSILFNKPFIAIGNSSRGLSRFVSLLSLFKQEFRLVYADELNSINIKNYLDAPNADLNSLRKISLEFLNKIYE